MELLSALHYHIIRDILDLGHAPDTDRLADLLGLSPDQIASGLQELQEYHGVVLHPNSDRIWVCHPFSLAPTLFWVESAKGSWWGNCAWCSLGVAALLQEDCRISTTLGAHEERTVVEIREGRITDSNLWVHFPVPMKNAWDNVIYTCSTMLLFRSPEEVDLWSAQHQIPKGDVQPISKIWAFAQRWYGRHRDRNWKKWTMEEAKAIFEEFDLSHEVWQLDVQAGRF